MIKLTRYTMIGLSVLFFGCETQSYSSEVKTVQNVMYSSTGIKDLSSESKTIVTLELDDAVLKFINQWTSFHVLKGEIDKLKSNNHSIFDLTANDIKPIFDNLNVGIPKLFDTNSIWSRFKVLETNVYNYNTLVTVKNNTLDQKKSNQNKILTSYYNLILQINKTYEKSTQIEFNQIQ